VTTPEGRAPARPSPDPKEATVRVVATKDFKAYINYQTLHIPKGQEVKGVTAAHLLATGSPVKRIDPEPEPVTEDGDQEHEPVTDDGGPGADSPSGELDIDATADEVMAWVDEDPDRAVQALEAEQARDKPRSTLVKKLEKLTETE
jgi:hypothetical protein